MKESTLLETSGISFSIINPHNGTTLVLELPPGQRSTWLILRGPLGEKTFHVKVDDNPEAGDLDLVVEMFTNASRRAHGEGRAEARAEARGEGRGEARGEGRVEARGEGRVEGPDQGARHEAGTPWHESLIRRTRRSGRAFR